ncbi:hypothetical protein NE236_37060 [Actinoallomurus purpureus]|uniref:hypothetical protein n=1 Tax=Actinoallomurus purpureus TaxID=478114 RepID=UPI00209380A0|nr:hypothetical protein [Actinoallomurus purpureus]MCO6010583.1 hypothetical protein [Actinoallomurus purpureus]
MPVFLPSRRQFRRVPILVVDVDGVTHTADRLHLPWSNVAEVRIVSMQGPKAEPVPVLMFIAVDDERVFREAGW